MAFDGQIQEYQILTFWIAVYKSHDLIWHFLPMQTL